MPVYTYLCKKCKMRFDLLVGVGSGTQELACPECANTNIEKQPAVFSVSTSSKDTCDTCRSCPEGRCPLEKE